MAPRLARRHRHSRGRGRACVGRRLRCGSPPIRLPKFKHQLGRVGERQRDLNDDATAAIQPEWLHTESMAIAKAQRAGPGSRAWESRLQTRIRGRLTTTGCSWSVVGVRHYTLSACLTAASSCVARCAASSIDIDTTPRVDRDPAVPDTGVGCPRHGPDRFYPQVGIVLHAFTHDLSLLVRDGSRRPVRVRARPGAASMSQLGRLASPPFKYFSTSSRSRPKPRWASQSANTTAFVDASTSWYVPYSSARGSRRRDRCRLSPCRSAARRRRASRVRSAGDTREV